MDLPFSWFCQAAYLTSLSRFLEIDQNPLGSLLISCCFEIQLRKNPCQNAGRILSGGLLLFSYHVLIHFSWKIHQNPLWRFLLRSYYFLITFSLEIHSDLLWRRPPHFLRKYFILREFIRHHALRDGVAEGRGAMSSVSWAQYSSSGWWFMVLSLKNLLGG